MPYVVLGDFNKTDDYFSARGIVITILIENHLEKSENKDAIAWEKEFVARLKKKKSDIYSMSYMTEISIEVSSVHLISKVIIACRMKSIEPVHRTKLLLL